MNLFTVRIVVLFAEEAVPLLAGPLTSLTVCVALILVFAD